MEDFHDLLKCAICNQKYQDTPVSLTCCGASVCKNHVEEKLDENSKKRKKHTCVLCNASHEIESKRFAPNKTAEKLIEMKFDKLKMGKAYDEANKECETLETSLNKMNDLIKDPHNFIFEHIGELKRSTDLRREKFNAICDEMIKKLDSYQQECYENIKKVKSKEVNETEKLLLEIKSCLDEWQQTNKLLTIDDSKRIEMHLKAKEFNEKLRVGLVKIHNELLMNKFWFHVQNRRVDAEIQDELILFEGYF